MPWNFPFPIGCWKAAPALAAGNCVVLKPASLSPLTALALGELAHAPVCRRACLQVLPGPGGAIGEALTTHPLIRKISFTGSTEVGRRIMELAARDFKRVSLELGGKSPNIVFADADWQRAAETSPMSVFANTGQDCCARSRMFVERAIYDAVRGEVRRGDEKARGRRPRQDRNAARARWFPPASATTVEEYLADARSRGSQFACGGARPHPKATTSNPPCCWTSAQDDRCWREEIFGPVVCVTPFDDEAAMLREVNASPYGLSGSIWTNDLRRALRVARAVESGV